VSTSQSAARQGQNIKFEDRPSPYEWMARKAVHLLFARMAKTSLRSLQQTTHTLWMPDCFDTKSTKIRLTISWKPFTSSMIGIRATRRRSATPIDARFARSWRIIPRTGTGLNQFIGKLPFGSLIRSTPTHLFEYPDLAAPWSTFCLPSNRSNRVQALLSCRSRHNACSRNTVRPVDLLEPRRAFIRSIKTVPRTCGTCGDDRALSVRSPYHRDALR